MSGEQALSQTASQTGNPNHQSPEKDQSSPVSRVSPRSKEDLDSETQESLSCHLSGLDPSPQSTLPAKPSETVRATLSPGRAAEMAQGTDDNRSSTLDVGRQLRQRSEARSLAEADSVAAIMEPLTDEERQSWPGWVELESDPALFNFILREYGVTNVKVQEVLGLESSLLDMLPQPVYGLIFLFKYRDDDEEPREEAPKYPRQVWFANQTIHNACATIALLNIVMNVPDIDLGATLAAFKTETKDLKPPYRGKRLGDNVFIRNIHNSFARRMDILNADLALYEDVQKWERSRKNKRKRATKKQKVDENEPGFHFIAYVPIDGAVWKLDGLRRQPENLGSSLEEDWISVAVPHINEQMSNYQQDGVQFNLLSLCRSPLRSCPERLAENFHALEMLSKILEAIRPEWKQFIEAQETAILAGADNGLGVTQDLIDRTTVPDELTIKIKCVANDAGAAMLLYQDLVRDQMQLQRAYWDEVALIDQENEQADNRKHDYTPLIYSSIKTLSEKGVLKDIVGECQ